MMIIQVKLIGNEEKSIEVDPEESIASVKKKVEAEMCIPCNAQRLVFKGRSLADSSTIRESKISKNSKIHLFRKSEPVQQQQDEKQTDALWTELKTFLDKHFSEEDALKVLCNFKEDFRATLNKLSLDDLERLGKYHLEKTVSDKVEK